jgi:hypothetical protein
MALLGGLLLTFLIKPFFTRMREKESAVLALKRENEPLLFEFVEKLLVQRSMEPGATTSQRIEADRRINPWTNQSRHRAGKADSAAWVRDNTLLAGLRLGLRETFDYLLQTQASLEEFESWILEKNGGAIEQERIERLNTALSAAGCVGQPADAHAEPVLSADDLAYWNEHGYVVLHDAVTAENCRAAVDAICAFVHADLDRPDTWYGASQGHSIWVPLLHHPAVQANRESARIHRAFAQLWNREDIWVNVDQAGMNPPRNPGGLRPSALGREPCAAGSFRRPGHSLSCRHGAEPGRVHLRPGFSSQDRRLAGLSGGREGSACARLHGGSRADSRARRRSGDLAPGAAPWEQSEPRGCHGSLYGSAVPPPGATIPSGADRAIEISPATRKKTPPRILSDVPVFS